MTIRSGELADTTPTRESEVQRYRSSETYLFADRDDGSIKVAFQGADLRLNGDYLVELRLSRDDVAQLARAAFKGMDFLEVTRLLSKQSDD